MTCGRLADYTITRYRPNLTKGRPHGAGWLRDGRMQPYHMSSWLLNKNWHPDRHTRLRSQVREMGRPEYPGVDLGTLGRRRENANGKLRTRGRSVIAFMSALIAKRRNSGQSTTSASTVLRGLLQVQIEVEVEGVKSNTALTDHRTKAGV